MIQSLIWGRTLAQNTLICLSTNARKRKVCQALLGVDTSNKIWHNTCLVCLVSVCIGPCYAGHGGHGARMHEFLMIDYNQSYEGSHSQCTSGAPKARSTIILIFKVEESC